MLFLVLKLFTTVTVCCYKKKVISWARKIRRSGKKHIAKMEMWDVRPRRALLPPAKISSRIAWSVTCRVCHQFSYVYWSLDCPCTSGCDLRKTRGPGVVSKNYWVVSYFPFRKLSCVVIFIRAVKPTHVIRSSRDLLQIHKPDKKWRSSASLFKILYILKILNCNFLQA